MKIFRADPRKPVDSFAVHIKILKICGLWPTEDKTKQKRYNYYYWFCVMSWLYIFLITQFMYLFQVRDLTELASAMYFFLIQLAMVPKVYNMKHHQKRLQNCINILESDLFLSQNKEEDEFVDTAIFRTLLFHRMEISMCYSCIIVWSITVFIEGSNKTTIIPAKFPFDVSQGFGFIFSFIYQLVAVSYSAFTHMTYDTLATGLFFHAASQIDRLGNRLANLGYNEINVDARESKMIMSSGSKRINNGENHQIVTDTKGTNYSELMRCIKHHKEIITYLDELQDVFKESLFAQLLSTLIILCMTEFLLMNFTQGDSLMFFNLFPYFLIVTFQIWQLCYTGNEVCYASKTLVEKAYFSNFLAFDIVTSKTLVIFMERLKRDIFVVVGVIFKMRLDIQTFLSIMQASYSYFAVLRSAQDK